MNKTLIIIICIVAIGAVVFAISSRTKSTAPIVIPSDQVAEPVKSDIESATTGGTSSVGVYDASVSFVGYGPGKQHTGTISNTTSTVGDTTTGKLTGSIDVDMTTLSSDTEKLTEHLKTADFFDVVKYPTAKFVFTNNTETTATGNLTVHGVTKSVTVPFTKTSAGYESTFTIDMSEFGIEQTFANEEVTVTIALTK